jgi:hypothetical protein
MLRLLTTVSVCQSDVGSHRQHAGAGIPNVRIVGDVDRADAAGIQADIGVLRRNRRVSRIAAHARVIELTA